MSRFKINRYHWEVLALFVMMLLNFIALPLSGGESQYLSFAKQYMNPEWIPGSFSLSEFPGTRIFFQYIFGWPLHYLDIETASILYRAFNFFLIAFPLAKIFRKLTLPFIPSLFMFQIFLSGQSLMAKEWMIGTFEPKTIAYVFFLWAFYFFLQKKRMACILSALAACFFHVIVGGWFLIALLIVAVWNGSWKKYIKASIVLLLLFAPFLFYLSPLFSSPDSLNGELSANHIYVYFRLPHHLGIAKSLDYFLSIHLSNSILTLLFFTLGILAHKKKVQADLSPWIIVGFGISMLYIALAFIDSFLLNQAGSLGLKYYPFRLNSFAYLLFLMLASLFIVRLKIFDLHKKRLHVLFLSTCVLFSVVRCYKGFERKAEFASMKQYHDMCKHAENISQKGDVFLFNAREAYGWKYYNFSVFSNRENYSIYKFVPAETIKLMKWYERIQKQKDFKRGDRAPDIFFEKESIDFLINEEPLDHPSFKLEYQNAEYYLYSFKGDRINF
ncbi:MAG: hypothetical protein AAF487_05220 [Bacteroidota bacterium]